MRKLIIVMKKVKSSIESQNVKFGDLIRSQQQNGSKRWWESEDIQNTNLWVCESKKGEKFMG